MGTHLLAGELDFAVGLETPETVSAARERVTRELDLHRDVWEVFQTYPKQPTDPGTRWPTNSDVAVVVQGPVIESADQTLQTLKYYGESFPGASIVFSTWDDAPRECLSQAERMGVHVVTGPIPEHSGPAHLNCQILSTHRGLQVAQELGAKIALKTRADTRLYAPHIGDFLLGLLKAFPVAGPGQQGHRIAVLDFVTRLYVPYHLSDMLMFGHLDDLMKYWSMPLCGPEVELRAATEMADFVNNPIPEVLLCQHYLRSLGLTVDGTIDHWWQVLADLFIVVDRPSVDFFWPKYNYSEAHAMSEEDAVGNLAMCSFRDWVNIAIGRQRPTITLDELRQQKINQPVGGFLTDAVHGLTNMDVRKAG